MISLYDMCLELHNFFDTSRIFGVFTITDGKIDVPHIQNGQYFRIVGSVFNDGVYQDPVEGLHDEQFDGAVWLMAVPKEVVDLVAEINTWLETYSDVINSPYQSESFGGYSYSKGRGGSGESNDMPSWRSMFASRMSKWRKIRTV